MRGLSQRNAALTLLRELCENKTIDTNAVVYFADDDNTFDAKFLDTIRRETKTISLFNVGLLGGFLSSGPHLEDGKVWRKAAD